MGIFSSPASPIQRSYGPFGEISKNFGVLRRSEKNFTCEIFREEKQDCAETAHLGQKRQADVCGETGGRSRNFTCEIL